MTKTTKKNPNKLTVAQYIDHQLKVAGRPQTVIAKEAGFEQPNMISMLKTGKTKLALKRIPALARALHVDPRHLFMMCIEEYVPDALEAFEEILNQPTLTANEIEILKIIRNANPNNPKIRTEEEEKALHDLIANLSHSKEMLEVKETMERQAANSERAAAAKGESTQN